MILITGASSGIGEAAARAYAALGKNLILLARRKSKLDQLASDLSQKHRIEALSFEVDVTDTESLSKFASQAPLSRVDVLINNAGLALGAEPIQDGKLENWEKMIDVNLKGLLRTTHLVLPYFLKKGRGHIVNLGSVAARQIYPNGNIYCATKAAVKALNESLRLDLHGKGIRVTEISPAMVETEFSEVRFGDPLKAKSIYAGMTPLTATDIAESIVWCTERPAHVNIQELVIYPTDQASTTLVHRRG